MIMRIPILKSILRNLDWFEEARRHHVTPDGSIFLGGTNHRLKKAGDWDESKHPRADNGQFGSGSGGSSKPKKPSKTRRKMERREEAASQARVGGAIQSLLSGGSALDKIGWLNTSQKEPEKPATKPKEEAAPAKEPSILDIINQRNEQAAAMRGKVPSLEHPAPEKPKAKKPAPEKKPVEEPGDSEPSILDTMAQSWSQSEAMRGKVPTLEHPSRRSAREGGPEGGHSPRVLTRTERDYRDSQNQWDNDRRRMGIPVPGDELATLVIPGKIKVEDGELAGSKILSLGNKRAGVIQHTDGSFVVLSQVDRKTVDRKEFEHLDVANRYAEAWLKGGQEVPKQPEKPKAEEKPKPKVSLADQATKLKLKDLKKLPLGKLRSMQAALQKHPKFNNPAYPEGKKYDKALQMVEGAIYSKV